MDSIQLICIWALPVLFAVTVHEAAHGWVADRLGDPTARILGRLTLNPIKHIDWLGTVLVPMVLVLTTGFVFGWAKPVPVNKYNLKHPRRDWALVSVAGPVSNLLMAILWAGVAKLGMMFLGVGLPALFVIYVGKAGIAINLMLGILNLIPIPPLDGGHAVSSLLPSQAAKQFDKLEPYGFFILIFLLFSGALTWLIESPYTLLSKWMYAIFGLGI
jgi:Zn-dependent protease